MKVTRRQNYSIAPALMHLPSVLQRIYAARGISHPDALSKLMAALLPFHTLTDIHKATARLVSALAKQERILIVGDFDVDGATSTTLAVSALKAFGAHHVDYLVPNRFAFGYGLTPAIVDVAKNFDPQLIITVDNGITSVEGVLHAKSLGIDVLITDHHLPGKILPDAVAIVNPNQVGDLFPSKSIAGVGVIFYVMLALRAQLRTMRWFESNNLPEPNMSQFLDLVALGTIADVVGLDHNNRILVTHGLKRINQGLARPGLYALLSVAKRDPQHLSEMDLGFSVGPRLNAAGRLEDMTIGIECLLSTSLEAAIPFAEQLDELNQTRREIEMVMKEEAIQALESVVFTRLKVEEEPLILCVANDAWHQGVIGILAGRLKERYHRPVIAFAKVSDSEWKGSARSIPELNIRDILADVDALYPGLITKFGGHAMAAGLSIHADALDGFKKALESEVAKHLNPSMCTGEYLTDGSLSFQELTLDTALLLREAGPWGQYFPEPTFDDVFEILEQRLVGQHHLKLILRHEKGADAIHAIAFYVDTSVWPNHRVTHIRAVYTLDINHYRGKRSLQLKIIYFETADAKIVNNGFLEYLALT